MSLFEIIAAGPRDVFAEFDIEPADLAYLCSVEETLTPDIREWVMAQWQAEVEAQPWFEALHLKSRQVAAITQTMDRYLARLLSGERIEELYGEMERAASVAQRHGVRNTDLFQASTKLEAVLTGVVLQLFPSSDQQTIALVTLTKFLKSLLYVVMETYRREAANELEGRNRELASALEQQTASAEVLHAISASPGDLVPVFDAMLEKVRRLCEANFAVMNRYDGERFLPLAIYGVPASFEQQLLSHPPQPGPRNALSRLARGEEAVRIDDLRKAPAYRSGDPRARAIIELGGGRSYVVVALRKDGRLLGTLAAYRQDVRPFSDKHVALLQNFAAQAVIAMENAQLITETREALEQQTTTAEVLQVISRSTFDLDAVLQTVVGAAHRLCRSDYSVLFRKDREEYRFAAGFGISADYEERERRAVIRPGPGTIIGRALLAGCAVQIADAQTDPLYEGEAEQDAHTMLGVPLLRDGATIGGIGLARNRIEGFSERETQLVTTFADQAAIAIENARLIDETREALEQQTATAEVLQVINASPGDLAPVFDAMLEKAMRLCEASFGTFATWDGEFFHPYTHRGVPGAYVSALSAPVPASPGGILERIVQGEAIVHVPDLMETQAFRLGIPAAVAMVEEGGTRSAVWVTLRKDDTLLGVIVMFRQEVRPFTDKQIALLQNFAAQAVIAMENARLITETREALDQQTATAEVLQVINASPGDLVPVFDAMVDKALRLCEAAYGALAIFREDRYRAASTRGIPAKLVDFVSQEVTIYPGSPPELIRRGEETVHVADIRDFAREVPSPGLHAMIELGDARTSLWVALRKDSVVLGFFAIYRTEVRPFTDKQVALVRNFAAQAVIAMENARLLGELRERTDDLTEALEYQTATSDVLKVISRSTFDLQPVLDTVVQTAARLCEADGAGITLKAPDSELYRYVATSTLNGDFFDLLRQRSFRPGRDTMAGRVALEGKVVHVADIAADPDYALPEAITIGKIRTLLGVPLLRDGIIIGTLNLTRQRVEPFTERQIELIQTFADQAVIAVENARLLTETSEARDTAEAALSDLKAAQSRLIQAEKMASLGQLTAGIAHEIKNPLNFVNNFASLSVELLDELKEVAEPALAGLDEDKRDELDETIGLLTGNLEKIAEHGKRADNIVKSMLEHSRGVSGERREVDLNALVEEALNLAYHGARAQDQSFNITLERDFDQALQPIELVPQDITRVFLNLFGNGFYAANKRAQGANGANGGRDFRPVLKVTTCEAGDAVEVKVRDNGTGIPPDIRDKLFQPFFTTKPTGEGTGLGLSISYDVVTQQHGGTIAVDSAEDEFTEFTIRLPRQAPQGRANR